MQLQQFGARSAANRRDINLLRFSGLATLNLSGFRNSSGYLSNSVVFRACQASHRTCHCASALTTNSSSLLPITATAGASGLLLSPGLHVEADQHALHRRVKAARSR